MHPFPSHSRIGNCSTPAESRTGTRLARVADSLKARTFVVVLRGNFALYAGHEFGSRTQRNLRSVRKRLASSIIFDFGVSFPSVWISTEDYRRSGYWTSLWTMATAIPLHWSIILWRTESLTGAWYHTSIWPVLWTNGPALIKTYLRHTDCRATGTKIPCLVLLSISACEVELS